MITVQTHETEYLKVKLWRIPKRRLIEQLMRFQSYSEYDQSRELQEIRLILSKHIERLDTLCAQLVTSAVTNDIKHVMEMIVDFHTEHFFVSQTLRKYREVEKRLNRGYGNPKNSL